MVVDPGTMKNQNLLIDSLNKKNLIKEDVNWICITHSHLDHYRNLGLFLDAKVLDYWKIWDKDIMEFWKEDFTKDIRILKTPGHSYDNITLLVNTNKGLVAICGDVFWKKDFPTDDSYASNKKKLKESRKKILELADYIIPGHGGMYKVDREN